MWSNQVEEADWIAERLRGGHLLPTGYRAYARLLHPIEPDVDADSSLVRWAQVAAWSGVTLGPTTDFWQIALPEHLPEEPMPGGGNPASDVLGVHDGTTLTRPLRGHTTTPERCWFGIWEGYGWDSAVVPVEVRSGPRVRLPNRDFLLYTGPVEAGLFLPEVRELADLWWPEDRSWFVYGDVDLNCTYVGGSDVLVQALVEAAELEAIPVDAADPTAISREIPDWLDVRIEDAVQDLMNAGTAELPTSRFNLRFDFGEPRGATSKTHNEWGLRFSYSGSLASRDGWVRLSRTSDLEPQLRQMITIWVIDMVQV